MSELGLIRHLCDSKAWCSNPSARPVLSSTSLLSKMDESGEVQTWCRSVTVYLLPAHVRLGYLQKPNWRCCPSKPLTSGKKIWPSPNHLFQLLSLSFLPWFINPSSMPSLLGTYLYALSSHDGTGSFVTLVSRFTLSSKRPCSISPIGVLTNQKGPSFCPLGSVNNKQDWCLDSENIKTDTVSILFFSLYIWNPYSETLKIHLHSQNKPKTQRGLICE